MSYDAARSQEQRRILDGPIQDFVARFHSVAPTVILIAGGMASNLDRATQPYSQASPPPFSYQEAWLDLSTIFGAAPGLEMVGDVDIASHIVVANDTIDFLSIGPYHGFKAWCELNGYNYIVFNWDWRRRIENETAFFRDVFLPALEQAIAPSGGTLLQQLTIIGHSFGGLILKLFLNGAGPFVDGLANAVTVGTPFYGYGGQTPRFFSGEPYLNPCYSASEMARVISSMLGPYTLMFLDLATYNGVRLQLEQDPMFPLMAYPSMDADTNTPADPYHPSSPAPPPGKHRYPTWPAFQAGELSHALQIRAQISSKLPKPINDKFHNVRGVQGQGQNFSANTVVAQTWSCILPTFDPDRDPCPIFDHYGPGDDTIPAWSARLVSTPPENVHTVMGDVEHMMLMDQPKTLEVLQRLIQPEATFLSADDLARVLPRPFSGETDERELMEVLHTPGLRRHGRRVLVELVRSGYDPRRLARTFLKGVMKRNTQFRPKQLGPNDGSPDKGTSGPSRRERR